MGDFCSYWLWFYKAFLFFHWKTIFLNIPIGNVYIRHFCSWCHSVVTRLQKQRLASFGIIRVHLRAPLKPLKTIVLCCMGGFRVVLNWTPCCRETPVSRTATSLIAVFLPVWCWETPKRMKISKDVRCIRMKIIKT